MLTTLQVCFYWENALLGICLVCEPNQDLLKVLFSITFYKLLEVFVSVMMYASLRLNWTSEQYIKAYIAKCLFVDDKLCVYTM